MENTLADLINSNQCPSDDDVTRIASLLTQTDQRLSGCCDNIRCLQDDFRETLARYHTALDKALTVQKELIKTKSIYTRILAPIRRLPTEILIQIFFRSIGGNFSLFWLKRGPWVLGKVCRRWRQIVLSTPELWSGFTLFPHGNPRLFSDPAMLVSLLDTALRLSGQRSISVYANMPIGQLKDASKDIWKHLSLHSYRWKDIRLRMADSFAPLDAVPNDGLPSLKKLTLSMTSTMHDHACEALNASPRLMNLTLINDAAVPSLKPSIFSVFHYAFKYLRLLAHKFSRAGQSHSKPISHPSLCRLQVSDITILQHLILPTLSDLDLVGATNDQGCADIICSLLSRSKSTLRKFKIVCDTALHGLMNVLRATPKLTELTVEALEIEEGFVKGFFQAKDFLSSLQKVSFTVGNFTPSLEANIVLVDAMERRWGSAMRSFYISAPSIDWEIADDDAVRIKKMRGEGLDLMIIYANRRVL